MRLRISCCLRIGKIDTLGSIVGSIAEAIWGIPESTKTDIMAFLPDEMKKVMKLFYEHIK